MIFEVISIIIVRRKERRGGGGVSSEVGKGKKRYIVDHFETVVTPY